MSSQLHSTCWVCRGVTAVLISDTISVGRRMAERQWVCVSPGPVQPPWASASSSVRWGGRAPAADSQEGGLRHRTVAHGRRSSGAAPPLHACPAQTSLVENDMDSQRPLTSSFPLTLSPFPDSELPFGQEPVLQSGYFFFLFNHIKFNCSISCISFNLIKTYSASFMCEAQRYHLEEPSLIKLDNFLRGEHL